MPYTHQWEKKGVYRKYTGNITGEEIISAMNVVESDARFVEIRYVINDFLETKIIDIDSATINMMAALDKAAALTNPYIKIAILTSDNSMHQLADQYRNKFSAPPYPTCIFTDLGDARRWIERDPD